METKKDAAAVTTCREERKKNENGSKKRFSFRKSGYEGLLWILPAAVLLLIFSYYPPLDAFYHSLTDWNGTAAHFIGFDNFVRVFRDTLFWRSFGTMLFLTVTCMVIGNVCTLLLAELIYNNKSKRMGSFFRFMYVIPAIIPGIVTIMLWGKVILTGAPNGIMNTVIGWFGEIGRAHV